jgi:hypothetical protein
MKTSRYTRAQIIAILRKAEGGMPVAELRNPQSSAPAPVAQPAQMGKTQTRSLAHAG